MAAQRPPSDHPSGQDQSQPSDRSSPDKRDVELVKVVVTREGRKVSAQWAIHPQMKRDLPEDEWQELSELMVKVTGIVGQRFAKVLEAAEPDKPGTA
jgi:hypothetical protein